MKLTLTKEMLKLATQHQHRHLYFEKFEQLVRDTYPEWRNVPKNKIFKKFEEIHNREYKIQDLIREREICINLMKEQFVVKTFDKKLNEKQSKRNCEYWTNQIENIDEKLIELGYYPGNYPSYESLKAKSDLDKGFNYLVYLLIFGFIIYIISII
jgi:hypothetical protein